MALMKDILEYLVTMSGHFFFFFCFGDSGMIDGRDEIGY